VENGFIESFNGGLRDECLNTHLFWSIEDACEKIEAWRVDYNTRRPQSALANLPPAAFAASALRREGNNNQNGATTCRKLKPDPVRRSEQAQLNNRRTSVLNCPICGVMPSPASLEGRVNFSNTLSANTENESYYGEANSAMDANKTRG
jgi:Integrase core domain